MASTSSSGFNQTRFKNKNWLENSVPIFQKIRNSQKLCDIEFKVNETTIYAHRVVLAATVPFFYKMFCTEDQNRGSTVEMQMIDIDPIIIKNLIDYCYSGEIDITSNNIENLLVCANYFQLTEVYNACVDFMTSNLRPENLIFFKKIADINKLENLISAIYNYIACNFTQFSSRREFVNLTFEDFINVIGRDDLKVRSEVQVYEAAMKWVHSNALKGIAMLPTILKKIRLFFLPSEYLVNVVSKENLIKASIECRDILEEAKNNQLLAAKSTLSLTHYNPREYMNEKIYAVCGSNLKNCMKSSVWKLINGKWVKIANLHSERRWFGIALINKKIYVIGGKFCEISSTAVEIFDTDKNQWMIGKGLIESRDGPGIAQMNDCIYLCGGLWGNLHTKSVYCFSETRNEWRRIGLLNEERSYCSAVSLNGSIYALGGSSHISRSKNSCERYCPTTDKWSFVKEMLIFRFLFGAAVLHGKIYACGGKFHDTFLNTCEVYDPNTNIWTFITPMYEKRSNFSLVAANGKLYAIGGFNGLVQLSSVEEYSPETNIWKLVTPLPGPACDVVAVAIS